MKVLIIEDERSIADPMARVLGAQGFTVECAYDGTEGLKMLLRNQYDCAILDLNLPGVDGIEIAKRIRTEKKETPLLMVTARSQLYDKLTGFDTGADDYLTKPFAMQELIARVKALIRRSSKIIDSTLQFGQYSVCTDKNRLEKRNNDGSVETMIILSAKEIGVLEYLLRNQGRAISAEELLEHVWDSHIDLFTSTVKTHMKTLRSKLGILGDLIVTVKGKGYLVE